MTISERAVKKPTTVVMIFILLVALGIYCTFSMPVDMFPDMELPWIMVSTTYENAGPEEVEQSVTRTLEKSLSGVSGLKKLQSISSSGSSLVMLEMNYGTNLDAASNEIRDKIDLVRNYLPKDSKTPIMVKMDPSMIPIMMLSVNGNRTPEELRKYAEDIIQPRIEQIDGIASADIGGGREKSINVDIPRDRLEAYGLTITQIAQMIGSQNLQSAGGTITSGDINYTIKTAGKYKSLEDVRNTVISWKVEATDGSSAPSVRTIKLRDIADVYEGYKEETSLSFFNGEPCVVMILQKQSGKNSVAAAKAVRKQIEKIEKTLPRDVEIKETMNTTDDIEKTIQAVVSSVVEGALLAVLVLFVFLRSVKSTLIIGLTIPISLIITLALMYFRGMTLNMISLSGLLIGVGMLVDNSIVILENIYSYRERDAKPTVAAVLGSQEMISAVVSSTLTTICIFLPLLMFRSKLGMIGEIFEDLSFTIVFSLICSLIVAIVLVPVLSSKYLVIENVGGKRDDSKGGKVNRAFTKFFDKMDRVYAKIVRTVLHHKKITIGVLAALFVGSILIIPSVGYVFMPETASTNVSIDVELPKGTKLEVTEAVVRELDSIINQELKGVKFTTLTVGGIGMMSSTADTNTGKIRITLYKQDEREPGWDNAESAKDKLRPYFTKFPGATFTFGSNGNSMGNSGVTIELKSNDLNLLRSTSKNLKEVLLEKGTDIVNEVTSDLADGLPEVEILFDRDRMYSLGLNIYSVGNEIKANINGTTASRYEDAGDEIDMIVSLSDKDKEKLNDLESIFVTNSNGVRIPLSSFARYAESSAPVSIKRENQSRIVTITVKPKNGISLGIVQSKIQTLIDENIPAEEDLNISFSGDNAEFLEAAVNFLAIIFMAVALVFAIMASQFESFKDPFIVLFTIPLSFVGVVAIYLLSGSKFNIVTIMGVLMLVGVIVNNGIVLVDYTNLLRKRGYALEDACVESARSRLRPILMSTLTTLISLIPMAFFASEGTEIIQPISITVLGGLSFGSIMTLILMPILYYIFNVKSEKKRLAKLALIDKNLELEEEKK